MRSKKIPTAISDVILMYCYLSLNFFVSFRSALSKIEFCVASVLVLQQALHLVSWPCRRQRSMWSLDSWVVSSLDGICSRDTLANGVVADVRLPR